MSSSGDNVMEAKAQNQVPVHRQDDFNMVKLKKSLKQEQKRSLKHNVAKLTPAEIRSLNHGASLSESAAPSPRGSEYRSRHGLASNTPPLTPDTGSLSRNSIYQPQVERRSSSTLPTPPQSPARERRGSNGSSRHVVHAPKPISSTQVSQLANSGYLSRTSSASSYRGIATYRGPEVTRTGSLTMFAHPSPQIVANPLSQFSRPRQSTLTSQAPPRSNSDTSPVDDGANLVHNTERHKSLCDPSSGPSREHSPVRMSDSPVSMEDDRVPDKTPVDRVLSKSISAQDHSFAQSADAAAEADEPTEPSAKQRSQWRKTFNGTTESDQDLAPLRKEHRRRTFIKQTQCLHAIHYDDTKPGPQPLMRDTLKDELPSVRTSVFKDDAQNRTSKDSEYGQHPAVRPLSIDAGSSGVDSMSDSSPSSNKKGKERETDIDTDSDQQSMTSSVPSYSRCSCCGRVQKAGFESELSPVLENENIRTNFDFAASRTSMDSRRRPSVSNSHKYTPIIPMEVGKEMRQAKIEPIPEAPTVRNTPVPKVMGIVNKRGDVIGPSSTPLAIMPKTKIDPRLSRFGSLHARKEDPEEEKTQESEPEQITQAPRQLQRFGSLYGIRNEAKSQVPPMPPQPAQSAYQAQQAKHYSMPNVHRPIRSSRLAYQETPDQVPSVYDSVTVVPPRESNTTEEPKAINDRGSTDATINEDNNLEYDEDDFAVDLSSFDGSFVHRSLSRVATHNVSPPMTSSGRSGFHTPLANEANVTDNDTAVSNQGLHSQDLPQRMQQPVQPPEAGIGVALTTPSQSSESLAIDRGDWPLSSPDINALANGSTEPFPRSPTIVKIIPSAPISSSSSQKSGNGQLRLGDWILPESPKNVSATPSPNGLGQAVENRSIAAA